MSIFNPSQWKKTDIKDVSDTTLQQLDVRYINTGENVFEQTIDNLSVLNLNVASQGKLYFNGDNTTQTTAYQPNFVTNQINLFTSNNNTFTGEQKFENLKVKDTLGNTSKIYQSGNQLFLESSKGGIYFLTYSNNGITSATSYIDEVGNFITNNQIQGSTLKCNTFLINDLFKMIRSTNCEFQSLSPGAEFIFKTTQSSSAPGWSMIFNPNGQLYGMSTTITHLLETKELKFRDPNNFTLTPSRLYLSNSYDLVLENKINQTNSKIKFTTCNHAGVEKSMLLDELMNMSGGNDISISGKLSISSSITHMHSNQRYTIDNKKNGSSVVFQNYDTNGLMRELTIDPLLNISGANDIGCTRLLINNSAIDFTGYNSTKTNTQQISYSSISAIPQTSISTSQGQINFVPYITSSSLYNNITQAGDSIIYFNNNGGGLSICPWSSQLSGLRITATETKIYNTSVENIKFTDNTIQTTAMTETYLTSLIQSVVNQMSSLSSVPVGTILAYGGQYLDNLLNVISPPTGYLWCFGASVSQTTYSSLYSAIQNFYANGRTIPTGQFYLPDLRGATLKGTQTNSNFITQTQMLQPGEYQQNNVGAHKHQYTDRGVDSRNFAAGATSQGVRTSNGSYYTQGESYHATTNALLDADTRVNSVGVNYIIKF